MSPDVAFIRCQNGSLGAEGKGASLWATQEKAFQEAAWKMACFVTSLHLTARYSRASRRMTSWSSSSPMKATRTRPRNCEIQLSRQKDLADKRACVNKMGTCRM